MPTMTEDQTAYMTIRQARLRYIGLCNRAGELFRAGDVAGYERYWREAQTILRRDVYAH